MPTSLKIIADRLARELGSWSSVEYRVHRDYLRVEAIPPGSNFYPAYRNDIRYVETGLGERLFAAHLVTSRPQDEVIEVDYCDGKLAANSLRRPHGVNPREQVIIRRGFGTEGNGSSHRPEPFNTLFVGDQPIDKAMPKAVSLGTSRQLGRDCDRLLFPRVRSGNAAFDFVYDLDPETSIPLRIAAFPDEAARQQDVPLFVWAAKALERLEGHAVASRSGTILYDGPAGSRHVVYRDEIVVDEVKFNQAYPKSTFWPTITGETKVIDSVNGKNQFPKTNSKAVVGEPIRADTAEATVPIAGISVALGLGLLVVAVLLARRGR